MHYLESSPNNFSKLQEVRISKGVHTFKNLQEIKLALITDRMDAHRPTGTLSRLASPPQFPQKYKAARFDQHCISSAHLCQHVPADLPLLVT